MCKWKMISCICLVVGLEAASAQARGHQGAAPVCAAGQYNILQSMTCRQAQLFVQSHHYQGQNYLGEFFTCDGAPVAVYLDDQNCPGPTYAAPEAEHTLDDPNCIVGNFCHRYPGS